LVEGGGGGWRSLGPEVGSSSAKIRGAGRERGQQRPPLWLGQRVPRYLSSLEGGAFAGTAAAREDSGRLPDVWGGLGLLGVLGVLELGRGRLGMGQRPGQGQEGEEEQSQRATVGARRDLEPAPDLDHCRLARPARPRQTATISAMHHSRRPDA
jgi:hypothetical protein